MDDNNTIYEAQARLHETVVDRPQDALRHGELSVYAATGGIEPWANDRSNEQEPLLVDRRASDCTKSDGTKHKDDDWDGMADFEGFPWYRRPSPLWVLIPFGLLAISFGGLIAPRVELILNLTCREYFADMSKSDPTLPTIPVLFDGTRNEQCRIAPVQSRASQFNLYGNLIAGLLSAVTSPKIGSLSDRYGRTKFIALTSLGSLTSEVMFILAAKHPDTFNMNWILFGFALDGLCGSFTTAFSIVHAYTSDCIAPAGRSVAFAMFHGCLFTGLAVGPLIASLITRGTGSPVAPFYVVLAVHATFMLFVGLIVPESLSRPRQERAKTARKRAQQSLPTSDWIDHFRSINLLEPLQILWPTGPGTSHALRMNLSILAAIDFVMFSIAMGAMSVVLMYGNFRFGWQTYESGIYMSITNTFRVACLVIFLPLVIRLVRGPRKAMTARNLHVGVDKFDLGIIRTAVLFDTLGYIGYALAPTGACMTLAGVIASIGGIGSPTLQASLTKHVPQEKVGQLLGASGLLHALARVLAPAVCNGIYSLTVSTSFPQAIFVCLAGAFGFAFVLSCMLRTGVGYVEPQHDALVVSQPGETEYRDEM